MEFHREPPTSGHTRELAQQHQKRDDGRNIPISLCWTTPSSDLGNNSHRQSREVTFLSEKACHVSFINNSFLKNIRIGRRRMRWVTDEESDGIEVFIVNMIIYVVHEIGGQYTEIVFLIKVFFWKVNGRMLLEDEIALRRRRSTPKPRRSVLRINDSLDWNWEISPLSRVRTLQYLESFLRIFNVKGPLQRWSILDEQLWQLWQSQLSPECFIFLSYQ